MDAYLEGQMNSWTFVRRLVKAGVSVAAAVAFAALLPVSARSGDFSGLERLVAKTAEARPDEAAMVQQLMKHVAKGWVHIDRGGSEKHLGHSLVKLSLNVANQNVQNAALNFNNNVGRVPVNVSGNMNLALNEVAARPTQEQNWALSMGGTVGEMPINLQGFVDVTTGRGPGHVNLNLIGNLGAIPVNFNASPGGD